MNAPGSLGDPARNRVTPMGPGTEFDLVRALLRGAGDPGAKVLVGPGDDAAVIDVEQLVVSTDVSLEDIHFRRSWISLEEAGFRAVVAAASDLAAMAARPLGVLVSAACEAEGAAATLAELGKGIRRALTELGAELVGGDLSASPGPVLLGVTVLGEATDPVTRRGAEVGDELWVTGVLGGSAGAVRAWQEGREPSRGLREAFARPSARIREACWLSERAEIHAMIDVSDGLEADAGHLAAASGVRMEITADRLPLHPELPPADAPMIALRGGEDYELCIVSAPRALEGLDAAFEKHFGVRLTKVGSVQRGAGVSLEPRDHSFRDAGGAGFDHFFSREPSC